MTKTGAGKIRIWSGREIPKIDGRIVRLLFGGSWPNAGGFCWDAVNSFGISEPGVIQGYDGSGEPVGPLIECSLRALSSEEALTREETA